MSTGNSCYPFNIYSATTVCVTTWITKASERLYIGCSSFIDSNDRKGDHGFEASTNGRTYLNLTRVSWTQWLLSFRGRQGWAGLQGKESGATAARHSSSGCLELRHIQGHGSCVALASYIWRCMTGRVTMFRSTLNRLLVTWGHRARGMSRSN